MGCGEQSVGRYSPHRHVPRPSERSILEFVDEGLSNSLGAAKDGSVSILQGKRAPNTKP